jgi:hypothetical protein
MYAVAVHPDLNSYLNKHGARTIYRKGHARFGVVTLLTDIGLPRNAPRDVADDSIVVYLWIRFVDRGHRPLPLLLQTTASDPIPMTKRGEAQTVTGPREGCDAD